MSLAAADSWFSKFIRLRDANEDGIVKCISCGQPVRWTQCDCGHFIKRQHKSTRYNEINCNGQCKECNWLKQGNDIHYAEGLRKKYGEGIVQELEALKNGTLHLGKFELSVITEHYKEKVKELRKKKGL